MQQILNHTFEDKRRVEDRFERERQRLNERTPTQEPSVLQTTLSAIERSQLNQIEMLRQQLERRDREMAELRQQTETARTRPSPLENPDVLKVLFGRNQEDAARIVDQQKHDLHLAQARHEREIEAERERHRREIEQHQREMEAEGERHRREVEQHQRETLLTRERAQEDLDRLIDQQKSELDLERERHQRTLEGERERHRRDLEQHEREAVTNRERQQRDLERQQREAELERERNQRDQERHQRELGAAAERHDRDVAAERRDREQQIAVIERLHRSEIETLRNSQAQLIMTKDEHLARLTDELSRLRSTANPPDALSDLRRVGEVVSAVREFVPGLSAEPSEPASPWDKMLERAGPLMERIADNLTKPPPVHIVAPPAAPRTPTPSMPSPAPAPSRPLRRIPGSSVPLDRHPHGRRPASERPAASAPTAAPPPRAPSLEPSPTIPTATAAPTPAAAAAPATTVLEGLTYLEDAVRKGKPVADVSRESRTLFPAIFLQQLVSAGPERVLGEIEQRSPDSVLVSPGGKRYLRELIDVFRADLDAAR
jgi:hypothetical protein